MHYLIIDTCNWIDLCKKYAKLRGKIADLLAQGRVVLIVPQVVLDEWERNKPYRQLEDSIRGQIKNARAIAQHLPQEEADTLKRILDEFQLSKGEIERVVGTPIQAIDGLLKYHSTVTLEAPDRVKLQAVDLALAKKAPFGSRNGMADALVVLSALDYATEQGLDNCIFVSSNTSDFSSDSDERQIHPDLAPLFEICGMKYYANIGQAINEIETGLVSDDGICRLLKASVLCLTYLAFVKLFLRVSIGGQPVLSPCATPCSRVNVNRRTVSSPLAQRCCSRVSKNGRTVSSPCATPCSRVSVNRWIVSSPLAQRCCFRVSKNGRTVSSPCATPCSRVSVNRRIVSSRCATPCSRVAARR